MSSAAVHRAIWQRRYAGELEGGAALLVALTMAEMAEPGSGAVTVGYRALAEITGLGKATISRAIDRAGLYEMADAGAGRRPARYVLASSTPDATSVDNPGPELRSVPPEVRNSVPPSGLSVPFASRFGAVASSPPDAQLEPQILEPGFSVRALDEPAPADLAERVAELRACMDTHPSTPEPLEEIPPPCLADAVPAGEVAERVAELRARMNGLRRAR